MYQMQFFLRWCFQGTQPWYSTRDYFIVHQNLLQYWINSNTYSVHIHWGQKEINLLAAYMWIHSRIHPMLFHQMGNVSSCLWCGYSVSYISETQIHICISKVTLLLPQTVICSWEVITAILSESRNVIRDFNWFVTSSTKIRNNGYWLSVYTKRFLHNIH